MSISVLNTDAGLSGKTILNAEDPQTISGNKTFSGNVALTLVTSNLLFTDASYDIGASGATRPRHYYGSGNLTVGGTVTLGNTSSVYFSGRTQISSPTDGKVLLVNAAGISFDSLQFGGTSSSFPALKRSGAALELKLADDSAYGTLGLANLVANGSINLNGASPSLDATVGSLIISSVGDVTIDLDNDNNGSNAFIIRSGANTELIKVDEAGSLMLQAAVGISFDGFSSPHTFIYEAANDDLRCVVGGTLSLQMKPTEANFQAILRCGTGFHAASATALPAGGSNTVHMLLSTSNLGVYAGSGAPTVTAAKGSIYLRSDGSSTTTRIYVNTDGGTTWTYLLAGV